MRRPRSMAALHNPKPEVRALAAPIVVAAYVGTDRELPDNLVHEITDMAQHDRAFGPRFQARLVGLETGLDIPLDNPDGVYAFQVQVKGDKQFSRTIELRSSDTLEDLHLAIQDALDWDNDHLYSFYMSGHAHDTTSEIPGYAEDDAEPAFTIVDTLDLWSTAGPEETAGAEEPADIRDGTGAEADADEEDEEEDEEFTTLTAGMIRLGALGLALKHKFLYMFDYGDENLFEIQVVGVRPAAEPGTYPRVVAAKGEPPEQYPAWDDDADFDEDDELEAEDDEEA